MDRADRERMYVECGKVFYVSSTAAMKERLWSYAKFSVRGRVDVFDMRGNASMLGGEDVVRAEGVVKREGRRVVDGLNRYPYMRGFVAAGERWRPDYVVRRGNVSEDLGRLLAGMGCARRFEDVNVHESVSQGAGFVEDVVREGGGEWMFEWLSEVARANEEGLKKLRAFLE